VPGIGIVPVAFDKRAVDGFRLVEMTGFLPLDSLRSSLSAVVVTLCLRKQTRMRRMGVRPLPSLDVGNRGHGSFLGLKLTACGSDFCASAESTTRSTRRLCARPSSVSLRSAGAFSA
jgi:hypothetical protein